MLCYRKGKGKNLQSLRLRLGEALGSRVLHTLRQCTDLMRLDAVAGVDSGWLLETSQPSHGIPAMRTIPWLVHRAHMPYDRRHLIGVQDVSDHYARPACEHSEQLSCLRRTARKEGKALSRSIVATVGEAYIMPEPVCSRSRKSSSSRSIAGGLAHYSEVGWRRAYPAL